jgi:hypothetical protein
MPNSDVLAKRVTQRKCLAVARHVFGRCMFTRRVRALLLL